MFFVFGKNKKLHPRLLQFKKINYGCGYDKKDGYLNVDVDKACHPDHLIPIGDLSSLPTNYYEELFAKDVLEHIPRSQTLSALLNFARILEPGGKLIVQTSSILHIAQKLIDNPKFADQYGWSWTAPMPVDDPAVYLDCPYAGRRSCRIFWTAPMPVDDPAVYLDCPYAGRRSCRIF